MSDNEAFNKCTTNASTRVDFVAEANAKSSAVLWLAYCEKKMELEDAQDRIEQLEEALQHLLDVQNGPPLAGQYAEEWQAAVDKARAALGENK